MNAKNKHSLKAFDGKQWAKDTKKKHFRAQKKTVFKAFQEHPKTMLQVANQTGIMRSNICRYVAKWKKADRIQVLYFGVCPVTGFKKVQFLTTDKNLFVQPSKTLFQ